MLRFLGPEPSIPPWHVEYNLINGSGIIGTGSSTNDTSTNNIDIQYIIRSSIGSTGDGLRIDILRFDQDKVHVDQDNVHESARLVLPKGL